MSRSTHLYILFQVNCAPLQSFGRKEEPIQGLWVVFFSLFFFLLLKTVIFRSFRAGIFADHKERTRLQQGFYPPSSPLALSEARFNKQDLR